MDTPPPDGFEVRPLTIDDARHIARWRYSGRWSGYDLAAADQIVDEIASYWALFDPGGTLTGFVCVGGAARVSGLEPNPALVDVGVGLHPALMGRGIAAAFGDAAVNHVARTYPGRRLRAAIQEWNTRSRRFAERLGFTTVGDLDSGAGERRVRYVILLGPGAEGRADSIGRRGLGDPVTEQPSE